MTGGPVLSLAPGPRLPFFPSMTRAELARLLGAPPSPAGKSRVWVEAAVPGEGPARELFPFPTIAGGAS